MITVSTSSSAVSTSSSAVSTSSSAVSNYVPLAKNKFMLYNPERVPSPHLPPAAGGVNLCWWNTLIHFMLACAPLNTFIINKLEEFDTEFGKAYAVFIKNLIQLSTVNAEIALEGSITSSVDNNAHKISYYRDLSKKISVYHDAVRAAYMRQYAEVTGQRVIMGTQNCVEEAFTYAIDFFGHRGVERIFRVVYKYVLHCPYCSRESISEDSEYTIKLRGEVINANKTITNEQEFTEYIYSNYAVVDTYACDCGHHHKSIRRASYLCRAREIIVMQFDKYFDKFKVYYPPKFELKTKDSTLVYRVIAQTEHSGVRSALPSLDNTAVITNTLFTGGHHWVIAKRGRDSNVYNINGSSITPAELAPTPETFMIMYALYEEKMNTAH